MEENCETRRRRSDNVPGGEIEGKSWGDVITKVARSSGRRETLP